MIGQQWVSESGRVMLFEADCVEALAALPKRTIDTVITDPPYGLKSMGDWDHGVPGVRFWRVIRDAVKPGALLLAFGGPRTYHRLACAIEDAGWALRDCVMWVYGSGYAHGLAIDRGIDAAKGAVRESRKVPVTEEAKRWQGWNTGLKPSYDPVCVAMNPIKGSYAENAMEYGVAGFWIDGARIPCDWVRERGESWLKGGISLSSRKRQWQGPTANEPGSTVADRVSDKGRWPANLLHDGSDEVMKCFPQTKSGKAAKGGHKRRSPKHKNAFGAFEGKRCEGDVLYGDSGSAARFFFCARASAAERRAYNEHPSVKPLALMEYLCRLTRTPEGGVVLDPFMGSGSTGIACLRNGRRFIGIETDNGYFETAKRRISEEERRLAGEKNSDSNSGDSP